MKRLVALLLAVIMIATVATFTVAPTAFAAYTGSGTEESPYLIPKSKFRAFIDDLMSDTDNEFKSKSFKFNFDIVFGADSYTFGDVVNGRVKFTFGTDVYYLGTGYNGTTVGALYNDSTGSTTVSRTFSASDFAVTTTQGEVTYDEFVRALSSFSGTIDFDGHKVSGIYYNASSSGNGVGGIFGTLDGNAKIMNLNVENSFIASSGVSSVGGIVGIATDNAQLINCKSDAVVCSDKPNVGGIVGSTSRNSVKAYENNHVRVVDCTNTGAIFGQYGASSNSTKNANAAGIVGWVRASEIIRCINTGDIYSNGRYTGGIAGLVDSCGQNNAVIGTVRIIDCVNAGDITTTFSADQYARSGGIIGYFDLYWSYPEGTEGIVKGCVSAGNLDTVVTQSAGSIIGEYNHPYRTVTGTNKARAAYVVIADNTYTGYFGNVDLKNYVHTTGGNKDAGTTDGAKMATAIVDLAEKYQNERPAISANYTYLLPTGELVTSLDGVGTKTNPIVITSASQFANINKKGYYYKVVGNITLTSALTNNYSNITAADGVKVTLPSGANAITNNYGTISNVEFVGNSSNPAVANNYGEISNVKTSGTFTGYASLVNDNKKSATVEYCENRASVTSTGGQYVGGIVCENSGTVYACSNFGNVNAAGHVGGIVGKTVISVKTTNSTFEGTANTNTYSVEGGTVTACANYASVTGNGTTAGIVGYVDKNGFDVDTESTGTLAYANIKGSNIGNVTSGKIPADALKGVVGKCYNYGNVKGNGIVGAIFANNGGLIIDECINTGTISDGTSGEIISSVPTVYVDNVLLKATDGKESSDGVFDGAYVRFSKILGQSVDYPSYLNDVPEDDGKTVQMNYAEVVQEGSNYYIDVGFTRPVEVYGKTSSNYRELYMGVRYATVDSNGKPSQINDYQCTFTSLSTALGSTNTKVIKNSNTIAYATQKRTTSDSVTRDVLRVKITTVNDGFLGRAHRDEGCYSFFCFEGLKIEVSGYTNRIGLVDNVIAISTTSNVAGGGITAEGNTDNNVLHLNVPEDTNKNNYTISGNVNFSGKTVTKADAANGKICALLNSFIGNDLFGQEIGTDIYPTIGGKEIAECAPAGANTYKTPARGTFASEDGSFVGFTAGGNRYTYGSTVSYPYVNVEYVKGFVTENGASVKVTSKDETGLRWTAKLPENTFGSAEIVSNGFIIVPTAYITGDYAVISGEKVKSKTVALDFTIDALKEKGLKYLDVKVDGLNENNEFSASVVNLLPAHYGLSYSARAYVKLKYSDGSVGYVYSGWEDGYVSYSAENARTPSEVAQKALADNSVVYSQKVGDILRAYLTEEPDSPAKNDADFTYPVYNDSAKYTEMKKTLRNFIYGQLQSGDKALFAFNSLKTLNASGTVTAEETFANVSANWNVSVTSAEVNGDEVITAIYTYKGLKFTTTVTLYSDSPSADILTEVEYTGSGVSPVINGLTGITASYKLTSGGKITLHTLTGSGATENDFSLVEKTLNEDEIRFSPNTAHTGLSSSWAWPYFDLMGENKGLLMAIGWSSQWEGIFSADSNGNANFAAKQQNFNMFLNPGEKVRTPSIVLTYFDGDYEYGHNIFRELILKHYTPDDDNDSSNGTNFKAPIALNSWGGSYDIVIANNVLRYAQYGVKADLVWFDTGWGSSNTYVKNVTNGMTNYKSRAELEAAIDADNRAEKSTNLQSQNFNPSPAWEALIGAYSINSTLFENGHFTNVTEAINQANDTYGTNYKFMVWWMIENHHDYNDLSGEYKVGGTPPAGNLNIYDANGNIITEQRYPNAEKGDYNTVRDSILNDEYSQVGYAELDESCYNAGQLCLEDDTVFDKVLYYYEEMFNKEGVQSIRLDSCLSPLNNWNKVDLAASQKKYPSSASNYRFGYSENKYVQNFYRLWDTLKSEYDDFFLDNCASGGRRLDIEMAKRSMPLWRTDYQSIHNDAMQFETQNLSLWLPLTAIGVASPNNRYQIRSLYSASTCVGGKQASDANIAAIDEIVDEYVDLRDYWYGNYYQLLDAKNDRVSWQSYELYREDLGEGMIVGIIREYTDETENAYSGISRSKTVKAKGLVSCGNYLVHNIDDTNGSSDFYMTGAELMNKGITFDGATSTISCYKLTLVD